MEFVRSPLQRFTVPDMQQHCHVKEMQLQAYKLTRANDAIGILQEIMPGID